ncbi:MAG: hypothetical protein ACHQRO_15440 [Vicinamibacteria bacterium]
MTGRASGRRSIACCLLGLFAALSVGGIQGRAQQPAVPSLLQPLADARMLAGAAQPSTLDARAVSVNLDALAANVIDVQVPSGLVVRAELDRRERHGNGAQTWAGHVADAPYSSVTLVSFEGVVQGSIRTLDGAYSLEPAGPGLHLIRQVEPRLLPPELEPIAAPADAADPTTDDPPIAGDDASTIDVLVLYTPGARTSAGGSDATVQTRIALGVSETNTGYGNSGVTPRLRLVGTQLWNYVESGSISTV